MPPIALPPVIAWTLGVLGAAALARVLAREWRRVNAELQRQEPAPTDGLDRDELPKLRRDPQTGIYRPEEISRRD